MGNGGRRGSQLRSQQAARAAGHSPTLAVALNKAEARIAGWVSSERAMVFTPEGRLVFEQQGTQDNVAFTPAQSAQLTGNILTHNHPPSPGIPPYPSPGDLKILMNRGLAEVRAVTGAWRFSLRPPTAGWGSLHYDQVASQLHAYTREEATALHPAVTSGKMSLDAAMDEVWQRSWTRLAQDTGIRYERQAWS